MLYPLASSGQSPPEWRITRELRIDAAEQDLSPIALVAVAPNGIIAVAQNQDGLVRFFDARGTFLGTFGRKGQGPGEFGTVSRFTWIADTLVVSDITTRRFTLISPNRTLVRTAPWLATITMAGRAGGPAPRFRAPLTFARYAGGDQLVGASLMEGSPPPDWPGGEKPGLPLVRVDSAGAFLRVIAWQPDIQCTVPFDAGRGGQGFASIPFCARLMRDVSADGDRFILSWVEQGSRPAFRVATFRANGDTAFNRSYAYEPVTISKAEKDSVVAARSRNPQLASAMERTTLPDTHPPLMRILPGRDETTWLELYTRTGERLWHVLDARGALIGRLRVPRNVEIKVGSAATIWATETDEDGLQHIVRFRVSRRINEFAVLRSVSRLSASE
jgi:hypothetical protein